MDTAVGGGAGGSITLETKDFFGNFISSLFCMFLLANQEFNSSRGSRGG